MPALVLCALAVRLPFVLGSDFPLGDGGMVAQIIDDIRAHGLALPAFTSYNGGAIPLCYPPLGFYLAVCPGLPTLVALRWLPLVLSVLVPCAVLLLARIVLDTEAGAFAAGLAAVFLPVPCWFGLQGGGLTRSLGLLSVVLAVAGLMWAGQRPAAHRIVLAGVALAAAGLSHPEATLMAPVLVVALLLAGPLRPTLRTLACVLGVASALVLPWLGLVLWRHGPGPWLAAFHGGEGLSGLGFAVHKIMAWWFTGETGPSPLAVLALLGVPVALLRRKALIVVWLLAPVFLVPRNCRFWSAPAIALLVGLALSVFVFDGLDRAARSHGAATLAKSAVLVVGVIYGLGLAQGWNGRTLLLASVPEEDRETLAWLAGRVRPGERIAAIDCEPSGLSALAEWAPYLARAESLVVPQGREWVGDGRRFAERASSLRQALQGGARNLQTWLQREPTVRWLAVGSLSVGDSRVAGTLVEAAGSGVLRLAHQRAGAAVWRVGSDAATAR